MTKLEVVSRVTEEEQHKVDTEGLCVYGDRVFTCADDGKVKVFDHHNLKLVHEFQPHDYCVNDVLVVKDILFTCSVDSTIKMWDAKTCQAKGTTGTHNESVRKLATDGTRLYAGDDGGEVRIYTLDGNAVATHSLVEEVWGLVAIDDLIYSVRDRGVTISQIKGETSKSAVMASIEGRAPIAVVGDNLLVADAAGHSICVRDNIKKSYKVKGELKGHELIMTAMAGHGQRVVSGGWDNLLKLWDLTTFQQLGSCDLPACPSALAMSEDGCIFATGGGGFVCKMKIT
ncbi:hypothetical protein Pmani_013546 [Petrolisthes manimaculis]|uniref:Myosin heavy chain kinase B n=1 Tax=Petrolisthes manimaculis TaxID=1843537 RepID=A0AAE1PVT2_9EUCA|nr:hypothetical protein Pmani_013546 [Petrolisthes manimaculis]